MTPLHPDETVLASRVARATGTRVLLVYNAGADPDQPWETICDVHGGVCSHETRRVAESWMPRPDEWCEDCQRGEGTLDGSRELVDDPTRPSADPAILIAPNHPDTEVPVNENTASKSTAAVERIRASNPDNDRFQAKCGECGWKSPLYSNRTIEGRRLADRDALNHRCAPDYRSSIRETLSRMSDEALSFQSARAVGGIDREEIDREIARRASAVSIPYCSCETPVIDVDHDAGCRRCGLPVDFTPKSPLETLRASLRPGWHLVEGSTQVQRGNVALMYGHGDTTGSRSLIASIHPDDLAGVSELYPEAFELEEPTLCSVHEPGACYPGCPDAYDLSEEEPEVVAPAPRPSDVVFGAARALVAVARADVDGSVDPIDDVVLAIARSSGGPYVLLSTIFRLLDSEEELDAARSLANWSSYGTETQYAMLRRVARGVVGDANGARETFADILHATSERAECWPPVRLAREIQDGLESISERENIWTHRRVARAEAIASGSTYDEASDAWTAASALDHPKGASR